VTPPITSIAYVLEYLRARHDLDAHAHAHTLTQSSATSTNSFVEGAAPLDVIVHDAQDVHDGNDGNDVHDGTDGQNVHDGQDCPPEKCEEGWGEWLLRQLHFWNKVAS
jgi:hypothetical protein